MSGTISQHLYNEQCKGVKAAMDAQEMERRGHVLAKSLGEVPILFCVKCGSFAARRAYGLAAACPGKPTPAGRQALARIRLGRQPWCDRASREYRPTLSCAPMAWDAATSNFVAPGPRRRATRRRAHGTDTARRADLGHSRTEIDLATDMDIGMDLDARANQDLVTDEPDPSDARRLGEYAALNTFHSVVDEAGGAAENDCSDMWIEEAIDGDAARHPACADGPAEVDHGAWDSQPAGMDIAMLKTTTDGQDSTGGDTPEGLPTNYGDTVGHDMRDGRGRCGEQKRLRVGAPSARRLAVDKAMRDGHDDSANEGAHYQDLGVSAISTGSTGAAVAREGPRGLEDPTSRSDAVAAACPTWGTAAATVAKDVVAATPHLQGTARCPHGRRGKVARGPASGVAVPLGDSEDAAGERTGQVSRTTSQKAPRAAGGGRPRLRRSVALTSTSTPRRLGARPSIGHAHSDGNGLPPKLVNARRRVGNSSPQAHVSAAWRCDIAAAQGLRERPQGGRPCRVPGAHHHECQTTEGGVDPGETNVSLTGACEARVGVDQGSSSAGVPHGPGTSSSNTGLDHLGKPPGPLSSALRAAGPAAGDMARPSARKRGGHGIDAGTTHEHRDEEGGGAVSKRPRTATDLCPEVGCSSVELGTFTPGGGAAQPSLGRRETRELPGQVGHRHVHHAQVQGARERRGGDEHNAARPGDAQGCHRPEHDELRRRHEHRHDEGARDPPQRSCGDKGQGPAGTSALINHDKHFDSDILAKGIPTSVVSASGDGHGWAPYHRTSTSSASTSSHCGIGGPPLHSSSRGVDLGTVTAGQDAAAGYAPVAEARQGVGHGHAEEEYLPAWLRTPSWLYLPHLVPPATIIHAEGEAGQGGDAGDDARAHAARIRGRGTSPGTRRPTPLDRAREKLAARNAHLARSLSDHAERVAKRRAQGNSSTPPVTPAERMAALRRRLADRGRADVQATSQQSTVAAAAGNEIGVGARAAPSGGHSENNCRLGSAVVHHAGEVRATEHAPGVRDRRQTGHGACRPLAEEDITPETGEWSTEDPKMHFPLHDQGIQMPQACQSQSHHDGAGGTSSTAAGVGRGNQHRSGEASGRQRGGTAPPDAASEAAASGVAWHTAVSSGCTDR